MTVIHESADALRAQPEGSFILIGPSEGLPRRLTVKRDARALIATVYPVTGFCMIAHTHAPPERCRIDFDVTPPSLWIGPCAFDVTEADAKALQETFELRVRP